MAEGRIQHGLVEPSVVVDPALDHGVEHPRQVGEGLVAALMEPPTADLPSHPHAGFLADRWREVHEMLPEPALRQPGPKRVPEERERHVLIPATPIRVLAVNDAGLGLIQVQPAFGQPAADRCQHFAGFPLGSAVRHSIIRVTLERDVREGPGHPRIEGVVQEDVGEHR